MIPGMLGRRKVSWMQIGDTRKRELINAGVDPEKIAHKAREILKECAGENFTIREGKLLIKELDYTLAQMEMRSLDSAIPKLTDDFVD